MSADATGDAVPPRPIAVTVDLDGIPSELKERAQWVLWRYELRKEKKTQVMKWTKVPFQPSGRQAKCNDRTTWSTFEVVGFKYISSKPEFDGIGYVFAQDDPYCGVDLDACRNAQTGELTDWAMEIVHAFDSYCEISPSDEGVKLIVQGRLPIPANKTGRAVKLKGVSSFGDRNPEVATYDKGRYWCLTGRSHDGTPQSPNDRQTVLDEFFKRYFNEKSKEKQPAPKPSVNGSAARLDKLIEECRTAGEGERSERDFALCAFCVRRGLDRESVWSQVKDVGKFSERGRDYFDTTWDNAEDRIEHEDTPDNRPTIEVDEKDLPILAGKAWDALQQANDPPALFRFGGMPARIEFGDTKEPFTRPLDEDRMRYHLARAARFTVWKKSGEDLVQKLVAPPDVLVKDLLASQDIELPILNRIVEAPVFGLDGRVQTKPGYHPGSATYYIPAAQFKVPDVPDIPSGLDVEHAREIICTELLGDFPFVGDAELAHAVSLNLLPFVRDLIDGPTPLHLFEKPTPGTGATLLVDMLAYPALGRAIPTMTEGRDEEEWRKRITAKLAASPSVVLIDNLLRRLDSAAVSAAITATVWEDRILGFSVMGRMPVRCAWVATGNNPAISTELTRRTVRIRLDAKRDRPWLRTGFRHENLRVWATENRGLLVWAALTLIRAWVHAGRPAGTKSLGMFENWSAVMGGILDVAGIPGFLANLTEFYEQSDSEGATWRGFLDAWWGMKRDTDVLVKDLYPIAIESGVALGDGKEQSQRVTLGKLIAQKRDRVFELQNDEQQEPVRLVITRGGTVRRATQWKLGIASW